MEVGKVCGKCLNVHGNIVLTGTGEIPCSADHEQDWQPYPVDPYSALCDDHTHTYIHTEGRLEVLLPLF